MVYQIGNIYGITAIAVIGGGLFGFDISSMSAMYVDSPRYHSRLKLTFTVCQLNNTAATSTRDLWAHHSLVLKKIALVLPPMCREESLLRKLALHMVHQFNN
jgi:hypothetical protein